MRSLYVIGVEGFVGIRYSTANTYDLTQDAALMWQQNSSRSLAAAAAAAAATARHSQHHYIHHVFFHGV
jgi:hypothetical protein